MRIDHSSSMVKILAVLLILVATWSLLAVKGNFVRSCSVEPQTVDVVVGSTFSVQIWLRNLDTGYMTSFYFTIS